MGMWLRWLDVRDPVWGSIIPLVIGVPGSKSVQELATSATKLWAMIDAIRDTYNGGKNIWTFVLDRPAAVRRSRHGRNYGSADDMDPRHITRLD
ncbi:hypothetical protein AB9F35_33830, partial [Rhizobium leguminosarum]